MWPNCNFRKKKTRKGQDAIRSNYLWYDGTLRSSSHACHSPAPVPRVAVALAAGHLCLLVAELQLVTCLDDFVLVDFARRAEPLRIGRHLRQRRDQTGQVVAQIALVAENHRLRVVLAVANLAPARFALARLDVLARVAAIRVFP